MISLEAFRPLSKVNHTRTGSLVNPRESNNGNSNASFGAAPCLSQIFVVIPNPLSKNCGNTLWIPLTRSYYTISHTDTRTINRHPKRDVLTTVTIDSARMTSHSSRSPETTSSYATSVAPITAIPLPRPVLTPPTGCNPNQPIYTHTQQHEYKTRLQLDRWMSVDPTVKLAGR